MNIREPKSKPSAEDVSSLKYLFEGPRKFYSEYLLVGISVDSAAIKKNGSAVFNNNLKSTRKDRAVSRVFNNVFVLTFVRPSGLEKPQKKPRKMKHVGVKIIDLEQHEIRAIADATVHYRYAFLYDRKLVYANRHTAVLPLPRNNEDSRYIAWCTFARLFIESTTNSKNFDLTSISLKYVYGTQAPYVKEYNLDDKFVIDVLALFRCNYSKNTNVLSTHELGIVDTASALFKDMYEGAYPEVVASRYISEAVLAAKKENPYLTLAWVTPNFRKGYVNGKRREATYRCLYR
jgi:hypothetical protein